MSIIEVFGWAGGWLLALCGLPLALESYKNKHSEGISLVFLLVWLLGEIFMIIYVLPQGDGPILLNLFFNVLFISIVLYYKLRPGRRHE
jgi:uncharacterized protein with PQ loop repeat